MWKPERQLEPLDDPPRMKTDEELVAAAMAGGPEAFAFIVERYQDAVFGVEG